MTYSDPWKTVCEKNGKYYGLAKFKSDTCLHLLMFAFYKQISFSHCGFSEYFAYIKVKQSSINHIEKSE